MKVHSVYNVRLSNEDESAFVIVLKVLEQDRYLPIYTDFQSAKNTAILLGGDPPPWMRDEEKARGIREFWEHVRVRAGFGSIRIWRRMFENDAWHDESGRSSSLVLAFQYGVPIFVDSELTPKCSTNSACPSLPC